MLNGTLLMFGMAFVAFFFQAIEYYAMGGHSPWIFRYGVKILDYKIDSISFHKNIGDTLTLDDASVKFVSENKILFYAVANTINDYGMRKMKTPFVLKGSITNRNGESFVEARIPLGSSTFITILMLLFLDMGGWIIFLSFLLITFFLIKYESQRVRDIVDEIELYITQSSSNIN